MNTLYKTNDKKGQGGVGPFKQSGVDRTYCGAKNVYADARH